MWKLYKAPWLEIRAKGWGKSQAARKMVRDHILSVHPNETVRLKEEKRR
jgi:hypothetical protein